MSNIDRNREPAIASRRAIVSGVIRSLRGPTGAA